MLGVYDAIKWRRSVRAYDEREVEEWKLRRVLDAGRLAPSGRNRQIWRFVVVRDAERRRRLMEACRGQRFVAEAPVVIAAVANETHHKTGSGAPAHPIDIAISVDHMVLAATELGLGTCWIASFDHDAVADILAIPQDKEIVVLFALGYPRDGWAVRQPQRLPLDEIVYEEEWERRASGDLVG